MKNFKILMAWLVTATLIVSCSKKDDSVKKDDTTKTTNSNVIQKAGTLTITITGDGYTNKTITYTGQKGSNAVSWAITYLKDTISGLGPDKNYSCANLYYLPPMYYPSSYDSSSSANGMVALRFSGNTTISNDPWRYTDLMDYRGLVEFSFKNNLTDASAVMYMIEKGVTVGSTTVTEYGTRVKGTFTATKMKKFDIFATTPIYVDISGSFDLDLAQ